MFESVRRSQVVRGARGYLKCFGFRLALTLAVAAGTVGSLRGAPQTPDFTGVDRFWEVADTLQQDREPTNDAWDALFSTPGYAALERREGRRSALQQGIRLALKPSLAAERESALASTSWTARVVRHIQQLPPERADLQRLRQQLAGDDVEARAMTAAQTLLPEGTTSRWPPPPIAFVFFLPDGRGYPDIIVADLANLARQDMVLFFAHELTHFYYARLSDEKNVRASTPTDEAKLNLLTKLFEESLGDQHDKAPYLRLSDAEFAAALLDADRREYLREYRQHYGNARALVEELNTALAGNDDKQINALAQRLPLEGRPLGFYMTSLVRARLGDGRLKTLVGDAFAWHAAFLEASRDR